MEDATLEFPRDISREIGKYIRDDVKRVEIIVNIMLTVVDETPEELGIIIKNKITYSDGSISSYSKNETNTYLSDIIPRLTFGELPGEANISLEHDKFIINNRCRSVGPYALHTCQLKSLVNSFKEVLDLIFFEEDAEDIIAKIKAMGHVISEESFGSVRIGKVDEPHILFEYIIF